MLRSLSPRFIPARSHLVKMGASFSCVECFAWSKVFHLVGHF